MTSVLLLVVLLRLDDFRLILLQYYANVDIAIRILALDSSPGSLLVQ